MVITNGTLSITNTSFYTSLSDEYLIAEPNKVITKSIVYPNPANSIVRLQLKDDVQRINDIRMYDGVGKLTVLLSRRINTGLYEINVSGLSPGIYIIQAKTAAGIKTFKFIKM